MAYRLAVVLMWFIFTTCGFHTGVVTSLQLLEVYLSKHGSDLMCGSKDSPCKTLQVGFEKLAWGGRVYVDGEGTDIDPYSCEASEGRLLVEKSFSMQSYTKMAHISCPRGLVITSHEHTEMIVNLTGITFKKTTISLENAHATIHDCVFMESSPALDVKLSRVVHGFNYYLNMERSLFKRNLGCIQVNVVSSGRCNSIAMDLKDTVFQDNKAHTSLARSCGLIFVSHVRCVCTSACFTSTWKNITVNNNSHKLEGCRYGNFHYNSHYGNSSIDKHAKYLKNNLHSKLKHTKTNDISNSFFAVHTCSAKLTFREVKSRNNINMRFLGLQSCKSYLRIYKSVFQGFRIHRSGGVFYIPDGDIVDVVIQDSHFSKNEANIGAVLQVDRGTSKTVTLKVINSTFTYCFGYDIGCVVSVGTKQSGVGNISASIDNVTFDRCFKKCKTGGCERQFGPLCLTAGKNALVNIRNAVFLRNRNLRGSLITITHSGEVSCGILHATLSGSTFFKNNANQKFLVTVEVCNSSSMSSSTLEVVNTVFLETIGTAIRVIRIQNVTLRNVTCNETTGMCFKYFTEGDPFKTMPRNTTLLIENSVFARNFFCLFLNFVQTNFLSVIIRKTTVLGNKRSHIFLVKLGMKRRNLQDIYGVVLLEQVNFTLNQNNRGIFTFAFIVPTFHNGSMSVIFRRCVFKSNSQTLERKTKGAKIPATIYLRAPEDQNVSKTNFPFYKYLNHFLFEDVVFENNFASTYFIYVTNGNVTFNRCLFKNNFSLQPKIGAHLFIQQGTASVTFHNSTFLQTELKKTFNGIKIGNDEDSSSMAFVFAGARGPLLFRNSSLTFDVSERTIPHSTIQTEGFVSFDNNTKFTCAVGSYMSLEDGSHIIRTGSQSGSINITQMKLLCKTCGVGRYSLQRGYMRGTKVMLIKCFEFCPFGADCSHNIENRPNFWGYKVWDNPLQLNFTICPEQYCQPPKTNHDPSVYSSCHGNRTGIMCGSCEKGFTENLFNHKCRPIDECNDGWFWVIAVLYSCIIAFYILKRPPIVRFLIKHLWWVKTETPNTQSTPEENQRHEGHGYTKEIFYFYQVANLLMLNTTSEILKRNIFISSLISFYNFEVDTFDSTFGCPFPGLNVVTKELFLSLQVFVAMVLLVVFYLFHCLMCLVTKKSCPHSAPYIASIIEILLLGYERLGHTSLELLNCTPLKINGRTKWQLFVDGNISCWVHWWQYALIAYNVIFVVPFLVVLLIGRSKLRRQQISACQFVGACFVPLPFLVYWGCQHLLSLINSRESIDNEDNNIEEAPHHETRHALLEVLQGPFRPPSNQSKGALYWESILIGRRLVLLCFYSFISTPMLRLFCMTIFCIVTLIHNTSTKPYTDTRVNAFALLFLGMHVVLATVNLCKSVLITVGVTPAGPVKTQIYALQILEVVIVSALPCMFLLLVICVVVSQAMRLVSIAVRYFTRLFQLMEGYQELENFSQLDEEQPNIQN